MGPGFRRESEGKFADACLKRNFFTCSQREKGRHDEVVPRGRADPPADEVQSVSLLCRLTNMKTC
jgi:hypothetical protein